MTPRAPLFGDIFRFKEEEYIFLAATQDIIYTARILNPELSRMTKKIFEKERNPRKIKNSLGYCFVELQTNEFKDRIAHFAGTGKGESADAQNLLVFDRIEKKLDRVDLEQMKAEIAGAPLAPELKGLVGKIDLQ